MKVRTRASAKKDLYSGYYFYEQQEVGIGDYFVNTISAEVSSLQVTAGIHSKRGKLFRVKSKFFPYWIYYSIKDNTVRVVAILDARQSPEKIYRREKKEIRK
ncbi:MAG: type II toxin-antitoxin system RelE/ParE family toxin [Chthoniobacterales bacterium]|nr:type II toxin-antitoxin system RelE/ParE family toxin [Chthoniobacterales bacterium]